MSIQDDVKVRRNAYYRRRMDGRDAETASGPLVGEVVEDESEPVLNPSRCFLCFDLDYFYCQVELLRRPDLRNKPVGVTQKYLVVTCNYEARRLGVGKLMGIAEALRRCPHLTLLNGEDLSAYRAVNETIVSLLRSRFGAVETIGLDEMIVECSRECESDDSAIAYEGFVHRVAGGEESGVDASDMVLSERTLALGSAIAKRTREAIRAESGLTCTAGIAHSKLLAKLAGSLHKPDAQTCLPLASVAPFIRSLPLARLPGIGGKREASLAVRLSTTGTSTTG
jgi:DNA polymerase iota